jgi:hypothetical protein
MNRKISAAGMASRSHNNQAAAIWMHHEQKHLSCRNGIEEAILIRCMQACME